MGKESTEQAKILETIGKKEEKIEQKIKKTSCQEDSCKDHRERKRRSQKEGRSWFQPISQAEANVEESRNAEQNTDVEQRTDVISTRSI